MANKKSAPKEELYQEVEKILGNSWAGAGDKCKNLLSQIYQKLKESENSTNIRKLEEQINKLTEENMVLKSRISLIRSICKVPPFYRTEEQNKTMEESD